jgi:dopamine beta-monooxygenase
MFKNIQEIFAAVFMLASFSSLISAQLESSHVKYETILDHKNNVRLKWSDLLDGNGKNFIFFRLTVLTPKLPITVGFGMSDRGEFTNADLFLVEVQMMRRKPPTVSFSDAYTDAEGIIHRDAKQDYNFLDARVEKLTTSTNAGPLFQVEIDFERALDTCDTENDYLIERGTVHLIHFLLVNKFQTVDGILGEPEQFSPRRDSDSAEMKQAQLIRSVYYENNQANFDKMNHKYFEVANRKIKLPGQDTTYWCTVYKLEPRFTRKHHIIAFESIISNASKGIVHHMELFHCVTDPSENMKSFSGVCTSEAKPPGLTQCRKVIAAWAMGATRFIYPEEVGGVIGGESYSQYLVLEIHFDNPDMKTDIVDSSGMRVFYQGGGEKTDEPLRKYDAGILEIGLEYNLKNSIPPGLDAFYLNGFCLSECTKAAFAKTNGITVFASQLHTHLTGRRVWTSIVREGRVVQTLNSDNHYDQMFQEIRLLPEPVRVRPGDALINTCVYNTRSRRNMTLGGYSIRDEMCVNYMHYFPASDLEVCKSSISDSVLDMYFNKMREYDLSNTSEANSIEQNFNSIRWTPLTAGILKRLYDISPVAFSCNSSDGQNIESVYRPDKLSGGEFKTEFEIALPENFNNYRAPLDFDLYSSCDNYD